MNAQKRINKSWCVVSFPTTAVGIVPCYGEFSILLVSGDWGLINFTEILLSDFFFGWGDWVEFTKYYFFVVEMIIKNELNPKKYYSFLVSNIKKLLKTVKTYQQNLYAVVYCVILYVFEDKLVNNFVS